MIKKITVFVIISLLMLAVVPVMSQEVTVLTPDEFPDKAEQYMDQKVQIEGLVVHVCKHGGKKMFLVGDDPEIRIKVDASDEVTVFSSDLEGSTVVVQGIVLPMAEEAVPEEEKHDEDADHKNYYHKKQYSISCSSYTVIE